MKKVCIVLCILTINILYLSAQTPKIQVEKGVLDLRQVDFDQIKHLKIEGEYEFFWNELLGPEDFSKQVIMPDAYIVQPGSWTNKIVNNQKLPLKGKGTYRVIIFADPSKTPYLSIYFREIMTAYKAWFNGQLVAQVGNPSDPPNFKPGVKPVITTQKIVNQRNELILQIANYNYRNNSIDVAPVIGTPENIQKQLNTNFAYNLLIMGLVLIMSFYHFGLFFFRRKNIDALIFAIFSFIIFVRIGVTDNYVFNYFFDFSWDFSYRIAYLTFYLGVPVFVHFFFVLFDDVKKQKIFIFVSYLMGLIFAITIAFSSYFFSRLLFLYQIATLVQIFIIFYYFFVYIKQKKESIYILTIGFICLFAAAINDILYYQDIIKTTTLTPVGVFLLILSQALALAKKFTNAFILNEKLNIELDYQNKHLEELVKERTKEIEKQKQEILQKNEELLQINEELLVQKEEILRQKDMLEEQNTLIKDSINYASIIQKSLLPDNDDISKYFSAFIIYLPKNIVSGDFYWMSDYQKDFLYFVVADCTGHGVPGAFISIISIYILNNLVNQQQISDPSEILTLFDEQFKEHLHKVSSKVPDGVAITLLRFEKNKMNRFIFAGSKQSIAIFYSKEKDIKRYKGSSRSIGIDTKAIELKFENIDFEVSNNDTIYLFSDGYIDQNNNKRERLGTSRFLSLLKDIADLPLQQQKVALARNIEEFKEIQPYRDDITIVALKVKTN